MVTPRTLAALRYRAPLALLLAALSSGCGLLGGGEPDEKKSKDDDDSAEEEKKKKDPPLIAKDLASITKDDMTPLCEKLGWGSGGVSWSDSGGMSNIMASCVKEDPNGVDSPDGKKRARMTLVIYKTDRVDAKQKEIDEKGGAHVTVGSHVFGVWRHDKAKAEAQAVLVKVLGKDVANRAPAGGAPPAASAAAPASAVAPVSDAAVAGATFQPKDEVDVNWSGDWWKGVILEVKDGPKYKVHYVGWESSWDEWVTPARVRPRTAGSRSQ